MNTRPLTASLILALAGAASATTLANRATPTAGLSAQDEALRQRVVTSLQEAPYFYDAHVNVSIEKGSVVLQGLVFSDWDLRDAIRIAAEAAEGHRVVDNLSIVEGGRR